MTSDKQTCFVYMVLPGRTVPVTVGKYVMTQTRTGESVGRFVYGQSYLSRADAVPIDPVELKLSDRVYETGILHGVFGALRDASPDFWGRRLIERQLGRADVTEIEYLLHAPDDRVGALGFGNTPEPPEPKRKFNRMIDLAHLQDIAERISRDEDFADSRKEQIAELFFVGTSIGGARPKTVVSDGSELWIAKFNCETDRWNMALVEHAMLTLARACGINVAESRTTKIAGKDVLLVKRFDREKTTEGFLRRRVVSALTVLHTDDSAVHRTQWSYVSLAEELRRFTAEPRKDAHELFRRMVFNALITNNDDHPRNHAFTADRDWRLSPAYDLTPYPSVGTERRDLAMVCGAHGRFANAANLISECGRFLLKPKEAALMIDEMTEYIRNNWYKTARNAGVSEIDCKTIAPAFVYPGFSLQITPR